MSVKKLIIIFITVFFLPIVVHAAEYNLNNNLLFGLSPNNVRISTGTISTDGSTEKTTQVLYDGFYDSISGNSGTRWAVETEPLGAMLEIEFDKVERIGKIIVVSGYTALTAQSPEIIEAFDIQYFDGAEYVTINSVKDNDQRFLELETEPFYTKKLRLISETNHNFRIREIIVLPVGCELNSPSSIVGNISVTFNGRIVSFYKDQPRISANGDKIMVPIMFAEEALGAQVTWMDDTRQIMVTKEDKTLLFKVGSRELETKSGITDIGAEVEIEESRVYVPIRALGEALGNDVMWDKDTNTVSVLSYEAKHLINSGNRDYADCKVYADGVEKEVFTTLNCDFVQITADKPVFVEVETKKELEKVHIRPSNLKIKPEYLVGSGNLAFTAQPGQFLSVEMNDDLERPLFVYINKSIAKPDINAPNVIYYEGGLRHNVGIKNLDDNTIVYLGENAIIDGGFAANGKKNIKILGNGIINGTAVKGSCTNFVNCENIEINGPVAVGANEWLNKWFCVNGGLIKDYKILGSLVYSDGIDLLGSSNITVDNIFVRNEDDCVAIKTKKSNINVSGNVENITVQNAVFWNGESGNSMEIGYELDGDYVRNITYKNIDVIHRGTKSSKFNRAAISIHHAGNATVSDILYEDVRVESTDEGLVNMTFFNMPNWGSGGGIIERVTVRNLSLMCGPEAPSYLSVSANSVENPMRGILFENLMYKGKKITSVQEAIMNGFKIDPAVDVKFVWRNENE